MSDADTPFRMKRGVLPFDRRSAEEVDGEHHIQNKSLGEEKHWTSQLEGQGEAGKGPCAQEMCYLLFTCVKDHV